MLEKPRFMTSMGLIQIFLAASFVIWLIFFPSTGGQFAWPVTPIYTAMFIGVGFIVRVFIGYFLWREKDWLKLRWQEKANLAFLIIIFLATYWHIDEMNWKTNIIVAHIWVVAYTVEPILLFLLEPRTPEAKARLPIELRGGPILPGLKNVMIFGLMVSTTISSIAFLNPEFLDTRWPWSLDPFNARVMAAFIVLAALWCIEVYFAQDWGEVRLAVLGLTIYAISNFGFWLYILPGLDKTRENVYTYGIAFALFSLLLIFFYWKQERGRP